MMVIRVPISTRAYGNLNGRSVTQRSGATLRGDRSMFPILRVDDPIRLMTNFGHMATNRMLMADSRVRSEADKPRASGAADLTRMTLAVFRARAEIASCHSHPPPNVGCVYAVSSRRCYRIRQI